MSLTETLGWAFEDWKTRTGYRWFGSAIRTAYIAGGREVIARQGEWEGLTESEAIEELRLGVESVFYPLFREDPRIWIDCPRDGRVTCGVEGYCDRCGWEPR